MNGFNKLFVIGMMVLFAGCAAKIDVPQTVNWDYNVNLDFAKLRTYDISPTPTTINIEELMVERIHAAIHSVMQAKNVQQSSQTPDFVIHVFGIRSKIFTTTWLGFNSNLIVEKGKLRLHFVDPQTHRIIWWGEARALLDPEREPALETQTVNDVVHRILKKFPPAAS
jgi:hypothetical protein